MSTNSNVVDCVKCFCNCVNKSNEKHFSSLIHGVFDELYVTWSPSNSFLWQIKADVFNWARKLCSFRLGGVCRGAIVFLMTSPTPIYSLLSDRRRIEPLQTRVHLQFFGLPRTLSNLAVSWTRALYSLASGGWNTARLFSHRLCAGFWLLCL